MTGFRGWHQRTIVILSSRGACRRTHRFPAAAESWPGLLHEAGDVVGDRLGVFDLRVMRRAGNALEAGAGQGGGELLAIGWGDDAVLGAPQNETRHGDPMQPVR